jgi:8-oxo-dGTP diphosphatase
MNVPPQRHTRLTVDVIITRPGHPRHFVLVKRRNAPLGWALPGGFVDDGETVEAAAEREAKEETGLNVRLVRQFHVYSEPGRDPRGHTITVVFIGEAEGDPTGGDDAADARCFSVDALPPDMAFDHEEIIRDFFSKRY